MQVMINPFLKWAICAGVFSLTINCGGSIREVRRIDPNQQTDLSGNWNDTDARATSQAMIQDCLAAGWMAEFLQSQGRKPAIRVREVANRTDEHIDAHVFLKSLEKALLQSGKVRLLAQEGGEIGSMEKEQERSASGKQSDRSPVSIGNEAGADFVLSTRMTSIVDQFDKRRAKFYKINMDLIDSTTGEKVWIGDHEIKKLIEQDDYRW